MVFPANRRGHIPIRPEKHVTTPIHDDQQIPRHMADLTTDGPPHPFLHGVLRVKVERCLRQAVDLLAEPAIKFLVIRPADLARVRMHTVSCGGAEVGPPIIELLSRAALPASSSPASTTTCIRVLMK